LGCSSSSGKLTTSPKFRTMTSAMIDDNDDKS
jgi:hypothetical protein